MYLCIGTLNANYFGSALHIYWEIMKLGEENRATKLRTFQGWQLESILDKPLKFWLLILIKYS